VGSAQYRHLPGVRGYPTFLVGNSAGHPVRSVHFLPQGSGRNGFTPKRLDGAKIEVMPTASNLSSTRRTIKALRTAERITESNIALATLALTTARALDEVLASGTKHYTVDRLARAHLSVLQALEAALGPEAPDAFAELLSEITTPTPGRTDELSERL